MAQISNSPREVEVWLDTFFVWPANLIVTSTGSSASNELLVVLGPGNPADVRVEVDSPEEGEPEVVRMTVDGAGVVEAALCLGGRRPRRRCGAGSELGEGVAGREGAVAASEPGGEACSLVLEAAEGDRPAAPAGLEPELARAAAGGAIEAEKSSEDWVLG